MPTIEEKLLLYRVKMKRDPDAFAVLYDRYVSPVYRYVYFKVSHKQEAEDITSDVFLKAWQYLIEEEQPDIGSFQQFIYAIARNCVIDVYRARVKKMTFELDTAIELPEPGSLAERVAIGSDMERLLGTIKKLKQEYQDVILLRYVEELSPGEIAEVLGKSHVSVRVTLHRAVKKLQELSAV